jgi:hypothetical protein
MLLTTKNVLIFRNTSLFLFFGIFFILRVSAQQNRSYSLSQLADHIYDKKDADLIIDWSKFYPSIKSNMLRFQKDIMAHPEKYPMQELENKDKKETDNFRRWEYQMRRMPVSIVTPDSNLIDVSVHTVNNITFCQTRSFFIELKIQNVSGFDLPDFYFTINRLPGVLLNYKNVKLSQGISLVNKSNTFVFNKGLKRNASKIISLNYIVGCDGRGGSPVLKGKSYTIVPFNWKLNLIGYLLNYKEKKLYKVLDFGKNPKTIYFKRLTK